MHRRIDWDIPALTVGVVSAASAVGLTQALQDQWTRRAARAASLAQAIQNAHDRSRMEGMIVLAVSLAFALTSAVARRRRTLWGLVPLATFILVGALVDARVNHEPNWSDDLANAPVLALFWLPASGLAAGLRAGLDAYRARRERV